jgi:RimJ/RimL family protein N-acetyltransferase
VRRIAGDDFTPKSIAEFVEYKIRQKELKTFAVVADGRIGGMVAFELANPVLAVMHVLFARWLWGTPAPAEGSRLACGRMFAGGVIKILALVPQNNRLAVALAVRNGGRIEGLLRDHTVQGGVPVNAVAVGLTKKDFDDGNGNRWIGGWQQFDHEPVIQPADSRDNGGHERGAEDILAGADGPAIEFDFSAPGVDTGERGATGTGAADAIGQPDQLGIQLNGRQDEPVPRGARVRAKRGKRKSGAANGDRKTGRTRK